ncbi:MAG: UDP-N-acetylmuramoylalanyl-D-glutamate--2,6-diaminopimelate ligase [Methylibium sp. NZG]|nr:MAG: UDP-N-acetylmuramoylalanyl-D-glutamate--2,6-diaminopimelate ligase [Methylibium sp. NZG]
MSPSRSLPFLDSVPAALAWLQQHSVRALSADSRSVKPGDAFIAWPGHAQDARQYVRQALAAGASACLVEADGADAFALGDSPFVAGMSGLKAATGEIASAFAGEPSRRLRMVAVTGTNGKTSTAWWTAQALSSLGQRCGVVGTLGVGEPLSAARPDAALAATGLTTPDPITLQGALRRFVDDGFDACAIEASSIGIVEYRLAGTHIAVAQFTNFTQDHLDFHGTMDAYWRAKSQLFDRPELKAAVINLDDAHGASLAYSLRGRPLVVWTYSARRDAKLRAANVRYEAGGLCFDVREGGIDAPVRTPLIGDYNVSNVLAVVGGLRALGVSLADASRACSALTPVPGRMQRVAHAGGGPEVVVDYAHTPDALEKALLALQPLAAQRGGALWCVFGCGGNRDATKRPLMGALAQRLAARVVVTSDNPRHEAPAAIIEQIAAGMAVRDNVAVFEDRRAAIAHAVGHAEGRDVILVAGKGHEDYQEIGGVKHAFADVVEARAALWQREVAA